MVTKFKISKVFSKEISWNEYEDEDRVVFEYWVKSPTSKNSKLLSSLIANSVKDSGIAKYITDNGEGHERGWSQMILKKISPKRFQDTKTTEKTVQIVAEKVISELEETDSSDITSFCIVAVVNGYSSAVIVEAVKGESRIRRVSMSKAKRLTESLKSKNRRFQDAQ